MFISRIVLTVGTSDSQESSVILFDLAKGMTQQVTVADNFVPVPMSDDTIIPVTPLARSKNITDDS